jgi:hypothetical protein
MMNNLVLVSILTLIIHFIGVISLSARIVGTRTRRLASSISIFNIIVLIAQFSNTIQAPLLTKAVENSIILHQAPNVAAFRMIIVFATIGSILGGLFIPATHRFMEKGVNAVYDKRSVFLVLMRSFKITTLKHLKKSLVMPQSANFKRLHRYRDLNLTVILLNVMVYSFTTVSVLSCLYAGYLNPDLRTTSLSLSGISSALGTVGMLLFIEPYNAILTDKVVEGTVTESFFRRHLAFVVIARIMGTICGQLLFIPLATLIARIAGFI